MMLLQRHFGEYEHSLGSPGRLEGTLFVLEKSKFFSISLLLGAQRAKLFVLPKE